MQLARYEPKVYGNKHGGPAGWGWISEARKPSTGTPPPTCLPKSPIRLVKSAREVTFHMGQLRSFPSNGPL